MYIQLDAHLLQRKDITPATKLIIGYIIARQGIEGIDWEYCPTEIAKQLGLNLGHTIKILDKIIERKLLPLKFMGWKRNPKTALTYKIYKIVATTPTVVATTPTVVATTPTVVATTPGVTIDQNKKPEVQSRSTIQNIKTSSDKSIITEKKIKQLMQLDKDYDDNKIGESMYKEMKQIIIYEH